MKRQNESENEALQTEDVPVKPIKKPKTITLITALVVLAVIILNVTVSLLGESQMWYFDMTKLRYVRMTEGLYTLSEECKTLVGDEIVPMIEQVNASRTKEGKDPIKLKIVFCADKDHIEADKMMRYVSFTARSLAKEFPEAIEVEYINIVKNPSAVQKYKTTSAANIYNSNVIVEFGTEYLVQKITSFYYQDATEDEPWAYNGEQRLCAMMLSTTRAESPVCALLSNHGETLFDKDGKIKQEYSTFVELIGGAGYAIEVIDLEKDEIPENCRMMISFDPQTDFKAFGNLGENNVSEIEKLDKYLDDSNAFFFICNRNTPTLPALEEYLEEWGVRVKRGETDADTMGNYTVKDAINCTDDTGDVIVGKYATEGLGATLTEDMRKIAYPARVLFGDSTAFDVPSGYLRVNVAADAEKGTEAFSYYNYYRNGINRNLLDVFTTYGTAYAEVDGEQYEVADDRRTFKLMTITQEERQIQESNFNSINRASYVIAMASTDFVKNDVLDSAAFGNTDVILSAMRNAGGEAVPANVTIKAFYIYDVEDAVAYASARPQVWMWCLVLIPPVVAAVVGTVVCIRRRYR